MGVVLNSTSSTVLVFAVFYILVLVATSTVSTCQHVHPAARRSLIVLEVLHSDWVLPDELFMNGKRLPKLSEKI